MLEIQTGQSNPILRQKAERVKEITAETKQLILDMIKIMETKDGIGLAAPQVKQPLRIIVVKPESDKPALALINPRIKRRSWKKSIMEEGCLSLPGISLPIKRADKITTEAMDTDGNKIKIRTNELLARIIQHETDHLEGILITDKAEKTKQP